MHSPNDGVETWIGKEIHEIRYLAQLLWCVVIKSAHAASEPRLVTNGVLERGMTERVPLDNINDRHLTEGVFQGSDGRSDVPPGWIHGSCGSRSLQPLVVSAGALADETVKFFVADACGQRAIRAFYGRLIHNLRAHRVPPLVVLFQHRRYAQRGDCLNRKFPDEFLWADFRKSDIQHRSPALGVEVAEQRIRANRGRNSHLTQDRPVVLLQSGVDDRRRMGQEIGEGLRCCDEMRGLHVGDSGIVVPECLDDEILVFVSTISRPLKP